MAKRGRPKKSSDAVGQAVLDRQSIYEPTYNGRRWWLLGIKVDEGRNQMPFHNAAFGGIPWQQGIQHQVMDDGWLGLDRHRIRLTRQILSVVQVLRAVAEIKQKVVRWKSRRRETPDRTVGRWAADVLSLENRLKTYDKKKEVFVPSGYRYQPGPDDEPLSRYLVFVPRSFLEKSSGGKLFEPDLNGVPTMLDIDSSLIPDRMSQRHQVVAGGDEVW